METGESGKVKVVNGNMGKWKSGSGTYKNGKVEK